MTLGEGISHVVFALIALLWASKERGPGRAFDQGMWIGVSGTLVGQVLWALIVWVARL